MPDLQDGEAVEMQGSAAKPYVLKNSGGVYSCRRPAGRNQSIAIEKRTCKHLHKWRGDAAEQARIGGALPPRPVRAKAGGEEGDQDSGPPLLPAESGDGAADLTGWWMSEKLDGVRAYWDGKQFLSRHDVAMKNAKPAPAAKPQTATPIVVAQGATAKPRYFEFVEGNSSKFWEVSQAGHTMTTRWGRIGSAGQSKTKTFADKPAAANAIAVLIEEKTDEGYVEKPR